MLYNDQALTGRGERAYCYAVSYSSKLAICNVSDVFFIVIMMLCKTVVVGSDKGRKSALKEISCGQDVIDQDVLWQLLLDVVRGRARGAAPGTTWARDYTQDSAGGI
jgi:hypothetical protein